MKPKAISLAVKTLFEAAKSANATYALVLKAFTLRSKEKDAFGAVTKPLEKRGLLVSWANETLNTANIEHSSLNDYIQKCASIVVAPADLVANVPDSKAENAPTHEVTPTTVKTRRELTALAEAANKAIGRKAKGKKRVAQTPAAPETAPAGDGKAITGLALYNAVKRALTTNADGTPDKDHSTVIKALTDCGFKLALVTLTPAVTPTKTALVIKVPKVTAKEVIAGKVKNPAPHVANARQ